MASNFNPQILADKLTKLNMSQQSIETLSHWCIFHMNKAKQVVETWDKQFHCSPREQRLAFLYLANDILQNSRRKGVEFVTEFWKVLPGSLRDVIEKGDDSGKKAALRLVNIWEERKVFGSRGQLLKEEFLKEQYPNDNRSLKNGGSKLRPPGGSSLDKLVSGYQAVYGSQLDEDTIFNKCRNALSFIEKWDKDVDNDYKLGQVNGSITEELKGQRAVLRDCVQHLTMVESSRANLVTLLRDALQEQEYKLHQVRNQLEAIQSHSEQADRSCSQLLVKHSDNCASASQDPQTFTTQEQSSSVISTRKASVPEKSEEDPKMSAAAVAAKLTASTSSAQMLTYVLSSLASGGVIGNSSNQSSNDYPPEKRVKLENDHPSYVPPENPIPPSEDPNPDEPPPPPSSPPPPLPPLPPPLQPYQVPQFMPASMIPYGYTMIHAPLEPALGYSPGPVGPAGTNGVSAYAPQSNAYQSYPTEGGFYGGQQTAPM